MMTVGKMLDWPEGEFDFLRGLVVYLFEQAKLKPGDPMPPEILKEFAIQRDYFSRMIEVRRRNPGQDVISSIVSAHDEKGAVSFEELLGLVTTIVLGGVPTTAELLTFLVYEMLNHPDQLELLRNNPDLAAGAVEETLRFDPPVTMTPRFALVDTEIGGVRIPAGSAVWPVMGAANRDPEQFKDPDIYDITRSPNDHLAFGEGVHFCIGNPTARLQGRLVAASIFHRFPRMRIVPGLRPHLSWHRDVPQHGPVAAPASIATLAPAAGWPGAARNVCTLEDHLLFQLRPPIPRSTSERLQLQSVVIIDVLDSHA